MKLLLIDKLKNVGGPQKLEAIGPGLLGLRVKRALPTPRTMINKEQEVTYHCFVGFLH